MRKALLQLVADGSIVAQKIAGQKKQIEKIELARASLQLLVSADQRPELVMEASGEIGIEAIEQHANVLAKRVAPIDRKSTRLNSSHVRISYAVFCLKKKKKTHKYFITNKKKISKRRSL